MTSSITVKPRCGTLPRPCAKTTWGLRFATRNAAFRSPPSPVPSVFFERIGKKRKTMVYPVVDDFADFLKSIPEDARTGHVFSPFRVTGAVSRRVDTVSNWIVAIGKEAGVKVDDRDGKTKFASAHDLRRAFGTRWAKIVPPGILKELMRHTSIETTMKFYVNIAAKETLAKVRRYLRKSNPTPAEVSKGDKR